MSVKPLEQEWLPESRLLYNQNMQAIKEHYPDLAEIVDGSPDSEGYIWTRTGQSGLPNLMDVDNGVYYYNELHPLEDARKQIDALGLKNTRIALFLGIGLGYELIYYINEMASAQHTSSIIVVEKDPAIFKAALRSVNLTKIISHPQVKLLVGVEEKDLFLQFQSYLKEQNRYWLVKAVKPVYHPSAFKMAKEYYINTIKNFRDAAVQMILYYGNDPFDALVGVENMLDNLDYILNNPGINLLFDKFKGRPGVVVATGPSLDKNKHLLKGLEGKALIVAADASLKVMMKMGVKPHFLVSLERGSAQVKPLVDNLDPEAVKDVHYAVCPVVDPEVFAAYAGPKTIVYRNYDHFRWLSVDKGILDIKMSAGNMAFKIAAALGCDPIILIGQDLAFSRQGTTHAFGTVGSVDGNMEFLHNVGKKMLVMGNDGEPIETADFWYQCIRGYEMDLADYQGQCINSTEGGAYIPGTTVMPFQEAIDRYLNEEFAPLEIIKEALSVFTPQQVEIDREKIKTIIGISIREMRGIIENCHEGLKRYEKYQDELRAYLLDPGQAEMDQDRLKFIDREMLEPKYNCQKYTFTFQLFFTHVFQSYHINFEVNNMAIRDKYDNDEIAMADLLLRHQEWYAVIADLGNICLDSLERAKEQVSNQETGAGLSKRRVNEWRMRF